MLHDIYREIHNLPFPTTNWRVCAVQGSRVSSFINLPARTIFDLLSVVIVRTLPVRFQLEIISRKTLQILSLEWG